MRRPVAPAVSGVPVSSPRPQTRVEDGVEELGPDPGMNDINTAGDDLDTIESVAC
jgi:hypothetical protein